MARLEIVLALICIGMVTARITCPCPIIFDPVCGTDGQDYPNRFCMHCDANVQVAYEGRCDEGPGVHHDS
ncbi:unnamed protein product [Colias eurytheme]|nr:unnamed protein product [Colias eurytheme]